MRKSAIMFAGAMALAMGNVSGQPATPGMPQPPHTVPVAAPRPPRPVGLFTPESSSSLVITVDNSDPQLVAQTEEDLNVMARILEKAINAGGDSRRAMGISIENSILGRDVPRNLYLDGYGALFIVNVPFPLVQPDNSNSNSEEESATNSEWDAARQELYAGAGGSGGFALDVSKLMIPHLGPSQPYDKGRVEDLKNDMIAALKNAAHIRKLKPEDRVTVVITSGGNSGGSRVITRSTEGSRSTVAVARAGGANGQSQPRMIIQAKRADIELFQKGSIDEEQFKKKVSITVS